MLPRRLLDADIRLGRSSTTVRHPVLDRALRGSPSWLVANQQVAHLTVDGVGTFTIEEGRRVVADLLAGAEQSEIREWIYGPVATIVLGQQGRVSLHATSISLVGSVVAIAGAPGSGKSTAGLTLQQRGHAFIADDLSPVDVRRTPGRPTTVSVVPFGRPVHVWPDAAAVIGLWIPEPSDTVGGSSKLALPAPDASPGELRRVVVLELGRSAAAVRASQVSRVPAVPLLTAHVHGVNIIQEIWPEQVFAWAVAVAETVPVYRVARPVSGCTVKETADEIERIAAGVAAGV